MGITGLLPFLEKSSKRTNINQFAGGTAAIDTYCWLHKGVFSCAEKVSMGQPTDAYVNYCMKFIHMLQSYKIKPILVFDGRHLPAKAQTEMKRRQTRETNRRKAIELIRMGQQAEGRNLLRRSIDITHKMALELIKQCQQMNIDCIVAPYEADAQLAYLNIIGIADVIITEDSDLTLFGCKKVFFKMDLNGNGLLVDHDKLHLAMGVNSEHFSMDDFRNMCILSGCDYLASLPGIGLNKARKFIQINTDCDIHRALTRLGSYLNMKSLVVTKEYRDAFILAIVTFKHQLVFCPLKRKQVRLYPPTTEVTEEQLYYAGTEVDSDIALQLAYGNYDPFTFKALHDFDPDKMENQINRSNAWGQKTGVSQHLSIWSKEYKLKENYLQESSSKRSLMLLPHTTNKEAIVHTKNIKRVISSKQQCSYDGGRFNDKEILDAYESKDSMNVENNLVLNVSTPDKDELSPVLIRRANPFARESPNNKTSPSLLIKSRSRMKGRSLMRPIRTVIDETTVTESKFFVKLSTEANDAINDDHKTHSDMNCSSQKENMEVENSAEISNINTKLAMINGAAEINSQCMDIDEVHGDISFALNKSTHNEDQTTSSNYDLGKSYLDISKNGPLPNRSNVTQSCSLNSLLTSSERDVDPDFLIREGDIDVVNNSLFKSSDAKASRQTNRLISNRLISNKTKSSSNSRISVNGKLNKSSSTSRSPQMCSVQRQQSLLSKYGFEKKKLN